MRVLVVSNHIDPKHPKFLRDVAGHKLLRVSDFDQAMTAVRNEQHKGRISFVVADPYPSDLTPICLDNFLAFLQRHEETRYLPVVIIPKRWDEPFTIRVPRGYSLRHAFVDPPTIFDMVNFTQELLGETKKIDSD